MSHYALNSTKNHVCTLNKFPAWKTCCKSSSNVQKSTVTDRYMCIYIYARALCLCSCRRKISQLIEYLKLPNRNFKFITQCTGSAESWTRADQTRSQHTHTHTRRTAGSQSSGASIQRPLPFRCVAVSFCLPFSLSLSHSWFGIKCHLIAI